MIQELFGERKISIIDGGILESIPPQPNSLTSSPPNSSTIITPISTPTTTTSSNNSENQQNQNQSQNQNLRCPRCDSSNTKFCYYNNYNLTQPRHFCKTCRRYWTKGGALRNVPIGGGCRKNRSGLSHVLTTALGKSTTSPTTISTKAGKMKIFSSLDHEINGQSGLDHLELSSSSGAASQVLWGSPQNSHILALLRATQNPNSNTNPFIGGTHMGTEPMCAPGAFNGQNNIMGLEPLISQVPSLWRNINNQFQAHHNQQQGERNNGFSGNDAGQNNGIHELYQRLRSSSMNCFTDHHHPAVVLSSNVGSTTTSRSFVLESSAAAPLGGGHHELGGYNWNPAFSCPSDFAATNGTAYP